MSVELLPVNNAVVAQEIAPQPRYQILSDQEWRNRYDFRTGAQKACDMTASLAREARYMCQSSWRQKFDSPDNYNKIEKPVEWKTGSDGLCVLLHGLNNDPMIWNPHIEELQKQTKTVDRFVPFIPHKGDCSLEEAAGPVLPHIQQYVAQNPAKPVCLIGTSNGGRLATWLEVQMRTAVPTTPVKVQTIGAVHFGSPLINKLEAKGVAHKFCSPIIREELAYGSEKAKALLEQLASPLPDGVAPRDYEFYASTEDFIFVPDLGTSLPVINKGEKVHILHSQGHSSIVEAVASRQITSALQWVNSFKE